MMPWRSEVSREAWRTLWAAGLGWMLDGMDVMLYAFALTAIQSEFGATSAAAGAVASAALLTSAVGGVVAGYLADRFGRVRVLVWSILVYSVFTGLSATAHSILQLAGWRALVGLGLGAEWSAGSVLVAETWPAAHRGKAIGLMQSGWALGYLLAAGLAAALLPRAGWRVLFVVGAAPAVLAFFVRRGIPEPTVWRAARHRHVSLFSPPLLRRVVIASTLCACVLFAYWGIFTWLPAYLSSPADRGGAGLGVLRTSAWIVPVQIGAFFGYTLFGVLADRAGRRRVFVVFVLGAACMTPLYGMLAGYPIVLLLLGPLMGFFGHGYFSVFGALLAELFPSAVRATAQGLCYNIGRAASAFAPALIGAVADRMGIGSALGITSAFFLAGAVLIFALPETKGEELA